MSGGRASRQKGDRAERDAAPAIAKYLVETVGVFFDERRVELHRQFPSITYSELERGLLIAHEILYAEGLERLCWARNIVRGARS